MKNATLLDMAVRETFSKRPLVNTSLRSKLLAARKFVLSESMSSYLADMTCAPFAYIVQSTLPLPPVTSIVERQNKRALELIESARHLARAPHTLTWIEYDSLARRRRSRGEYSNFIGTSSGTHEEDDSKICPRVGWLIEQHPGIPNAFTMIQISQLTDESDYENNYAVMMPYTMNWLTDDDGALPWRSMPFGPANEPSVIATGVSAYHSDRVGIGFAPGYDASFDAKAMAEMLRESVGELRALWFFLASLNDIPTTFDHVRPTKGYVAKGQYRRFSEHTVITLNVPMHRSLKTLAARALTNIRKRAHHVRGFWRIDWRHPPASQCEHDWKSVSEHTIRCAHCEGRKFFIAEHVRGDTSLGFVLHDYHVNKGQEENTP